MGDRNRQLPGPRWDAHDRGEQTTGDTMVSAREDIERVDVSGGQGVSHYGGQGEPPLRGGCARVPRSKCPQPSVKGTWSETQVDDQGGSVLPAIMAHFLSAID